MSYERNTLFELCSYAFLLGLAYKGDQYVWEIRLRSFREALSKMMALLQIVEDVDDEKITEVIENWLTK